MLLIESAFTSSMASAEDELRAWRQSCINGQVISGFGANSSALFTRMRSLFDDLISRHCDATEEDRWAIASVSRERAWRCAQLSESLRQSILSIFREQVSVLLHGIIVRYERALADIAGMHLLQSNDTTAASASSASSSVADTLWTSSAEGLIAAERAIEEFRSMAADLRPVLEDWDWNAEEMLPHVEMMLQSTAQAFASSNEMRLLQAKRVLGLSNSVASTRSQYSRSRKGWWPSGRPSLRLVGLLRPPRRSTFHTLVSYSTGPLLGFLPTTLSLGIQNDGDPLNVVHTNAYDISLSYASCSLLSCVIYALYRRKLENIHS